MNACRKLTTQYSSPILYGHSHQRPLPLKATLTKGYPLIRPDFRCTEIVKYYKIIPLLRGHISYKVTFSLQKGVAL